MYCSNDLRSVFMERLTNYQLQAVYGQRAILRTQKTYRIVWSIHADVFEYVHGDKH